MVSTRVTPKSQQVPVNVVGSSVFARYSKISSERTQNMFVTTNGAPRDAENFEEWLVNFPGYARILNFIPYPDPLPVPPERPNKLPAGTGRGLFHSNRGNLAVAVINSTVYRIASNLGVTAVGIISSTSGEVYMAENLSNQICIVDGVNCWIYNYVTGQFTVQDLNNANLIPNYVEYHNTFFLFGNGITTNAGSQWFAYISSGTNTITQVNPGTSALALQTKADRALAVKRIPGRGNNVLVMGETVCEVWTQVPGQLQPYIRNPSININYGCLSVATIAEGGNYIAWLGANEDESPVLMVYDGNQAARISTDGIDYLLSTVKAPATSTAMLYRQDGHLFYQLTFYDQRDNFTILYDFDTQMFFNLSDQYGACHPARSMMYFNLSVYFISLKNAALYKMSSDITYINENLPRTSVTSEYNEALIFNIHRARIASNIRQANSTRYRANSLVLTLEQGTDPDFTEADLQQILGNNIITEHAYNPPDDDVVTESGQVMITETAFNTDQGIIIDPINVLIPGATTGIIYMPRIDLSFSLTGGISWSNKAARTLHPYGYIQNILMWESMGVANDMVFKFEFWGTYRFIVNNALVDIII